MNREKFEELVKEGIDAIPERFLEKLDNVDIVIEDEPNEEQIKKLKLSKHSRLLGLYEGIPQTKRGYYSGALPDKITIFKKSIEEIAFNDERVKEIVKNTVWHEIAHHFGMDEERVRRAEKRK
ncbi:MAG: metallopeptidase family protein [bacterium]|nr:metallopeptidase family protein [bacterium]